MMRIGCIALFWGIPFMVWSQGFEEKYEELMGTGQLDRVPALLELWENSSPGDTRVYTTGFNHYLAISREQRLIMPSQVDTNAREGDTFISSEVYYNDSLFQISQDFIQRGIMQNPNRLDLHLGKIHALWLKADHQRMTGEILTLIQWDKKLDSHWYWEAEPAEQPKEWFKASILEYVVQLYGANQITYVRQISKQMLKSYPKDVPSLSNLGASYLTEGHYKKARKYFKKAHRAAPEDVVVLNNLGDTYDFMDKPDKAIHYYQKIQEYGNEQQQQYAAGKIQDIRLRMEQEN